MTQIVEQEDLGVLASNSSLSQLHQKTKRGTKEKNGLSPILGSQQRQVQNSVNIVVNAGRGLLVRVGWPGDLPMDGR